MRGVTFVRPEPIEIERFCACPKPAKARVYIGHWACVCGELIKP